MRIRRLATAAALAIAAAAASCSVPSVDTGSAERESVDVQASPSPIETIAYGAGPDRVADLSLPAGDGPFPVVVLVHGGFWRDAYRRDLMTDLAADLVRHGHAVWNIEYHRTGQAEGGYPGTFGDVAAAVDHLATVAETHPLDLQRVVSVGHSAGGHLALWIAARGRLPVEAVGARPVVEVCAAVSQSGVADLAAADDRGVGAGAVEALLGAPARTVPEVVAVTSPIELVPLGVPVLLVHGEADDIVPLWQSEAFADTARAAGDTVALEVTPSDHFAHLATSSPDWRAVTQFLDGVCAP